jgi:hypothetical protein
MKRIVLFSVVIGLIIPSLIAQNNINMTLKPNEPEKKEITIAGNSGSFNVLLELRWDEKDKRIRLIFDRKNISGGGEDYLLCIPLMRETKLVKDVEDCMSRKKNLYKSKNAKEIKGLKYFAESRDLKFNYETCYKYVAVNNELDFGFDIADDKDIILIRFNNLYVLKKEKRPWYTFSKRDMKLEYNAEPVELEITLKKDPCVEAGNLINDLKNQISQLENLKLKAENASKEKNCSNSNSELNRIKNDSLNAFKHNAEWDKYKECKELTDLIEKYKTTQDTISNIKCVEIKTKTKIKKTQQSSSCNLENANSRLYNLQKAINVKKLNGENTDSERNTFLNIVDTTTASPDCKGIEAYESYVNNIKKLLNIK